MKPGTKKTVRLATTFTAGAAFAPPMLAGALLPVGPHAIPNTITVKNCSTAGTSHWLHLAVSNSIGFSAVCLGGTGFKGITVSISKFCGGNNSGTIHGTNDSGKRMTINFGHGTTYRRVAPGGSELYRVTSVDMDGFGGTDKCPLG